MVQFKDSRKTFWLWMLVWLMGAMAYAWITDPAAAGIILQAAWAAVLTWLAVTGVVVFTILMATLVGHPFKPWTWFKK